MSIIIEGPDHVGKTTLGTRLSKELNLKMVHLGKPEKYPYDFNYFVNALKQEYGIWDRFHLGTIVYGMMLKCHENALSFTDFYLLDRLMEWRGDIVVVITAEKNYLRRRLKEDGKVEMFNTETILKANRGFKMMAQLTCPMQFEVSEESPFVTDAFVERIIQRWILASR